jgi:hypothetical protein
LFFTGSSAAENDGGEQARLGRGGERRGALATRRAVDGVALDVRRFQGGMPGDLRNPADCERFVGGAKDAVLVQTAGVIHPESRT